MNKYIKKIQSKNKNTRKLIFTASLILSMSFVLMIWVSGIGDRFGGPKIKEQTREDIKPFKLFGESMSNTYKNISASIGNISLSNQVPVKTEKQIDLIPIEKNTQ